MEIYLSINYDGCTCATFFWVFFYLGKFYLKNILKALLFASESLPKEDQFVHQKKLLFLLCETRQFCVYLNFVFLQFRKISKYIKINLPSNKFSYISYEIIQKQLYLPQNLTNSIDRYSNTTYCYQRLILLNSELPVNNFFMAHCHTCLR